MFVSILPFAVFEVFSCVSFEVQAAKVILNLAFLFSFFQYQAFVHV
jgi:hypothetical protein